MHTVTLNFITTPISVQSAALTVKSIINHEFTEVFEFTFPALQAGEYEAESLALSIDNPQYNFPYANYTFAFTTTKEIPNTGSIVITFPGYNFDAPNVDPICEQLVYSNLKGFFFIFFFFFLYCLQTDFDESTPITCTFSSN